MGGDVRLTPQQTSGIRKFVVPKLCFDADDYHLMIDWNSVQLTEPPITKSLSEERLDNLIR